jgi:sugar transferase (PEP-CTERM system associated)
LATAQIFKSYLKTPFIILLLTESCLIIGSVYSASYIRFYPHELAGASIFEHIGSSAILITLITTMAMVATGLYVGRLREGMAGVLIRIGISMAMSSVLVALAFYLIPELTVGRGILTLVYLQSFFIIGTLRTLFFELVDTSVFKSRVLVYGAGAEAAFIDTKLRRRADRRGFDIVGYVSIDDRDTMVDYGKLVTVESSLLDYSSEKMIDEIVVAAGAVKSGVKIDELADCKLNGIRVVDLLTFFEREAGQVRIDIMDPTWLVTSDGFYQSRTRDIVKRLFDLVVSTSLLILSIPVQILIVLAIWLEDGVGAPIFYRQERIGQQGRSFNVYKFRSMNSSAEKDGKAIWASKVDSRVTRIGGFLRKYRLDELPQVINVIKGDMSFVGPRPERPEFVKQLAEHIPYYKERHILKPGLTGWAQLNYPYGSSIEDAYEKQLYDMYYVKNHSLFLDCLILLHTVEVILFGKGAR